MKNRVALIENFRRGGQTHIMAPLNQAFHLITLDPLILNRWKIKPSCRSNAIIRLRNSGKKMKLHIDSKKKARTAVDMDSLSDDQIFADRRSGFPAVSRIHKIFSRNDVVVIYVLVQDRGTRLRTCRTNK